MFQAALPLRSGNISHGRPPGRMRPSLFRAGKYTSRTETVLINQGGSGQEALQSQEIYPPYIGALVVCDGADQPGIVLKVKEAVSVLTGLGTDCISVVKRSES